MAASRFFVPLIWLHVPVIAGIAISNHIVAWHPTLFMAAAALTATLAVTRSAGAISTRLIVAGALTCAPVLMVYAGAGLWQVDWHMYFFVVFGMLVAYVDWRPIVLATTLTALHHALLHLLFPAAVFPESDAGRVVLHAAMVAVDGAVLLLIVRQMAALFARVAQTNRELEGAVADRTIEINNLNSALSKKLAELEQAFAEHERDALERREVAGRLHHLAHYDPVTGLPNRSMLVDRLARALAAAARTRAHVLIVYLDLAEFKTVNDSLGHAAGDTALAAVATRLGACLRVNDTASRVGGDEFVIVCSAVNGVTESAGIAERLIRAVTLPLDVGSSRVELSANIGISLYPADGPNPDELIRKADAAMYRAKRDGPNTFHLYTPAIHAEMVEKSTLKRELEEALERDEFVVHFQPIVSLTSRAIIGAEALVRWQHPTRGLLAPGEFIEFAEQHGLIARIGISVLHQACRQINRFALRANDEFTLAVNVSALQFRQPNFVEDVLGVLATSDTDSSRLEIEITESVMMGDAQPVIERLRELEALGIKLSLDDFGTGYSSLAYIKNFPVHTLKIDRSFVRDVAENSTDQAIAAAIITLAHNLGMRVIAEGVETAEQLEQLRQLGADDVQGYLITRPLASADFERFVCSYGAIRLAA